jgi:hypothetical protein
MTGLSRRRSRVRVPSLPSPGSRARPNRDAPDRARARARPRSRGDYGHLSARRRSSYALVVTLLRDVAETDLDVFYHQQLDPEATAMAGFPARDRVELSTAAASVRGSTGCSASPRSNAASSARSRGTGTAGRTSSSTPSRRSLRPTFGNPRSASLGRDKSTRNRAPAAATPADHSVDFPIPAAPSSTNPAGPAAGRAKKASMTPNSSSLPTISCATDPQQV